MAPATGDDAGARSAWAIDAASSALLIEARSTVGRIELGSAALAGGAELSVSAGGVDLASAATAWLEVPVASLTSGNALYDSEVHRRLDARHFPVIRAELRGARPLDARRWAVEGDLTIHGTTCALSGSADVRVVDETRLRASGEQVIDIRDFSISLPTTLMLRIYPDVTVRFRIDITRES